MKDFMFFFRGPKDLKLTPEQSQFQLQKWHDWIAELTAKGQFIGGAPMTKEGKILKGTKTVITDGPFAEGKELLGGYLMIKAASMDEAAKISLGYPDYDLKHHYIYSAVLGALYADAGENAEALRLLKTAHDLTSSLAEKKRLQEKMYKL